MSLKKSNGQILLSEAYVLRCEACFSLTLFVEPFHLSLKFLFCQTELIISYDEKRTRVEEVNRKELQYSSKTAPELQELQASGLCPYTWCDLFSLFLLHTSTSKMNYTSSHFFSRTSWVSKSANATWAADWLNPACKHFIYIHSMPDTQMWETYSNPACVTESFLNLSCQTK